MEEKIKLSDLLLSCADFIEDPQLNEANMASMISKIQVRSYIPLGDKAKYVRAILDSAELIDENIVLLAMNLELGKAIYGLICGYCINVENDLDVSSVQLGVYDLIYQTGLADEILKYCERDYKIFCNLVDSAVNCSNVFNVMQAFSSVNPDNIEAFGDIIDSLKEELTPEKMDFLKKVYTAGTPESRVIPEVLAEKALSEALGEDVSTLIEKSTEKELKIDEKNSIINSIKKPETEDNEKNIS